MLLASKISGYFCQSGPNGDFALEQQIASSEIYGRGHVTWTRDLQKHDVAEAQIHKLCNLYNFNLVGLGHDQSLRRGQSRVGIPHSTGFSYHC